MDRPTRNASEKSRVTAVRKIDVLISMPLGAASACITKALVTATESNVPFPP